MLKRFMQKFKTIILDQDRALIILTFDRDKLNFLNAQMLHEFYNAIQLINSNVKRGTIKGLIVTGNANGFVPGLDLKEYLVKMHSSKKKFLKNLDEGRKAIRLLEQLPIPTVAAVNLFAIGGGLEIALACDFIFSDRSAQFGFPEVTLGLIPGAGGTVLLKERVGVAKAKEMIFSGHLINCKDAKKCGLVDFDCQPSNIVQKSKIFLSVLTKNSSKTIALAKKSIKSNSYKEEKSLFTRCVNSTHSKKLITQYLQ
jgi:enoyl-CoA hydratase